MSEIYTNDPLTTPRKQYVFAHVNRIAVRCHFCGCTTGNATHARDASGERIQICRKKCCVAKIERVRG